MLRTLTLLALVLGAGSLASLVTGCGSSSTSSDSGTDAASGGGGGNGGSSGAGGAGGASGAGTTTHCDIDNGGTQSCIEDAPDYTGSRPQACTVLHGTYATGPCSATSSSGGCRRTGTGQGTETVYFYMPTISPADVMATCTAEGNAIYIAP